MTRRPRHRAPSRPPAAGPLSSSVLAALLAALLAAACASSPKTPSPPLPHLSGKILVEELVTALRAADRVRDDALRFSLLDRIFRIAVDAGLKREAREILGLADAVLKRNAGREWYEEYGIVAAKRRLDLDEPGEALRRLSESLGRIRTFPEERRKKFLLAEIIDACLLGGEPFQPLLRDVIDTVLVMDSPEAKTELLSESARRLCGLGLIKDTQELLQLTLSQVGSVGSPWDKALVYSRVSLVYRALKNEVRVREYASRAAAEIESVQVVSRTDREAAVVGKAAETLAGLGLFPEALRVADTIEYPWILAETLCRMGLAGRDGLIDRAFAAAAAIADEGRRLSTLFQLDLLLVEAGRAADIAGNLPLREAELASARSLSAADGLVSRLARLYLETGDTDAALVQARSLRDGYNRASALIGIARVMGEKGRAAEAYAILDECAALAKGQNRSRDRLFQDIAGAYLDAGDFPRAAAAAMEIAEPYPFAVTVAETARSLLRSGKRLDAESRRLFGDFFARG